MKGLNVESGIFKRLADVLAVCVSALALSGQAMADVAAPPPSVHTEPTAGYLRYENGRLVGKTQGSWGTYDASTGVFRPQFNGSSRTSGGHVGNKTINVNFRDNFGNSAGGQIHTQTRTPGSSTLSKAAGAYVPMKEGRLLGAQGNFTAGEAVPLGAYHIDDKGGLVFEGASKDMFILPPPTGGSYGERYYYQTSSLMGDQITPEIREAMRNQNRPNLDVRDLLLNQQEIEAILNKRLDALLNSQQANADAITALLNAMWGSGLINTGNTQTNVTGGDAANTFTTAPYTPADGQQAQQTQFIVNNNGNVITNIVSRPDLAPHSSQAPTRQPIGGQSQTNTQSPNNPGTAQPAPNPGQSEGQKPDICKSSPNNIACADLGNTDYTDPELPQETRNLSFNPADIFASNGMCPQPKRVRILYSTVEISYKPLCDIAAGIRAIVILAGVMAALYMVWGEVQNG